MVDRQRAVGAARAGAGELHRRGGARRRKALDPTRPVGARRSTATRRPAAGRSTRPLDVIGINDYFGWYPGPNGQIADRDALSDYLDSVRACYPKKAIVVSEFGAEANRDGPVEEKGTYAVPAGLRRTTTSASTRRSRGSAARSTGRCRSSACGPNWDGGNPHPDPPIHEKGLLRFDGAKKPAWFDVQRLYTATPQLGAG